MYFKWEVYSRSEEHLRVNIKDSNFQGFFFTFPKFFFVQGFKKKDTIMLMEKLSLNKKKNIHMSAIKLIRRRRLL